MSGDHLKYVPRQNSDLRQKILDAIDIRHFYEKETSLEINAKPNGEAMILCVFHEDKDASLSINLDTGMFHCFGCNESGSLFDFYMKRHGVDFKTALKELAAEAGIELGTSSSKPFHKPNFSEKFRLSLGNEFPEIARNYLHKRGIIDLTIDSLLDMGKMGFNPHAYAGKDANNVRITVPAITFPMITYTPRWEQKETVGIQNIFSEPVICFEKDQAKKMSKRHEYGSKPSESFFVLGDMINSEYQIVTESVIDIISIWQTCKAPGCAIFGTSHINKLKNVSLTNPMLFFDNDNAGRKATVNALNVLTSAKVVRWSEDYPNKCDANDLLKADKAEDIVVLISGATEQTSSSDKYFWHENINNKGEITLCISHSGLLDFLKDKGIFNSEFQKEKILVRKQANILEIIRIDDVRNWLLKEFFREFPEKITENKDKAELREVLTKGINVYVQPAKIETLTRKPINILKDTEDRTYFFFGNGVIEVTADSISLTEYGKIRGDVWADSINRHHISIDPDSQSDYLQFITNISDSSDRYDAICTAHGYLLSRYNNPSYVPAVILSDGIIDDTPNGGTGKGIIAQALSYLRNQVYIDGKKTDLRNTFALQSIGLQTELILFDDVGKNFPFELLFSDITNGYQVEKKNKNKFSFRPGENPKTLITTNYAVRGTGHSFERRKAEIELYPYYGQNGKKPEDDFGSLFVWDKDEWNSFYNFLFQCVRMYHQNGNRIADYHSETLGLKKTINEIGMSFYEFAEEISIGEWLVASEYYEKYLLSISKRERDFMNVTKFGRKLKNYADGKGYQLDKKNFYPNIKKFMLYQ